jgi:hypothetical protein
LWKQLKKALSHLDTNRSPRQRDNAFAEVCSENSVGPAGSPEALSAFYTLQKFAEGHIESRRKSCEMTKSDLARAPLEIGDVDLVNSRLFGKVNLPPTPFLSELPDSFAKLDANIRRHSSSIDLVEALYLVDALSHKIRVDDGSMVPVLRIAPACRGGPATRRQWLRRQPKPKSYESFN